MDIGSINPPIYLSLYSRGSKQEEGWAHEEKNNEGGGGGGGEPGDHEFTCEPLIWLYQENKNSNWTQTRNELGWERVN